MTLLETMPGWPTAVDPSGVHMVALTVLGPLALLIVLAALAFAGRLTGREKRPGVARDLVYTDDEQQAEIARVRALIHDAHELPARHAGH